MLIKTNKAIRVPSGVRLRLTTKQLEARLHNVMDDVDGVVLVTHPMEFKAGEELEVVGDLPTVISADQYSVLDEPEAEGQNDRREDSESEDQNDVLEDPESEDQNGVVEDPESEDQNSVGEELEMVEIEPVKPPKSTKSPKTKLIAE